MAHSNMVKGGRSESGCLRKQSVRIMTREDNSDRDRNGKEKICIQCAFSGKLNEDKLCGSCNEEVTGKREICVTCDHWVESGGVECTRCGFWSHKHFEGFTEAAMRVIKSMKVWFCTPCSIEWKSDQQNNAKMIEELLVVKRRNAEINNKMQELEENFSGNKEVEDSDEAGPGEGG